MIARKVIYRGNFTADAVADMFDIVRKNEITGEVRATNNKEVVLNLEGDPSVIKLIQHQIDRKAKAFIQEKNIEQIPYQHYEGLTFER